MSDHGIALVSGLPDVRLNELLHFGGERFGFALTLDEDKKEFVLNVDKQKLENAPGFDKDNWPDMANMTWGATIYTYYGKKPYWDTTSIGTERPRAKTLTGGGGL